MFMAQSERGEADLIYASYVTRSRVSSLEKKVFDRLLRGKFNFIIF